MAALPLPSLALQTDRVFNTGYLPRLRGRLPLGDPRHIADYFYWDKSHPTDTGHKALAELLASVVLRAAMEASAPRTAAAAAGLGAWERGSRLGAQDGGLLLPPAMIPGNSDAATSLCALQVLCCLPRGVLGLPDGGALGCACAMLATRRAPHRTPYMVLQVVPLLCAAAGGLQARGGCLLRLPLPARAPRRAQPCGAEVGLDQQRAWWAWWLYAACSWLPLCPGAICWGCAAGVWGQYPTAAVGGALGCARHRPPRSPRSCRLLGGA